MPGLAGIYDARADAVEIGRVLERMQCVMDVPSFPCDVHTAMSAASGCIHMRRQAGSRSRPPGNGGHPQRDWIVFDGELYNRHELRTLSGCTNLGAADDDAGLCLALYASEGALFVRRLNGQFNLVIYRGAMQSLLIATDRYGYRPLFWAQCGARVLFATEMKAIIAAFDKTPSFDGTGILELLTHGHALGDRTWLEPIRVVDSGTLLEVTPTGISRQRYFRLRYHLRRETVSAVEFVEELGSKLVRATERMTRGSGRVGVLLSGGLDSRTLLLASAASRLPDAAFTFGDAESRDVRYGRELARLAGVPHLHLPYERGYLGRVLAPVVWRTEGLLPFATATFTSMSFHSRIGARADVLLYGHGGDSLTGARVRPEVVVRQSRNRMIDSVLRRHQQTAPEVVRRVFAAGFYARYAPGLPDALRATSADIDQEHLADVADVWDMENRQRRCTFHSPAVERYRFEVRAPFLDNDVVDHLVQSPLRWRFQQMAYKRMIVGCFPHAARVPWAYTGWPIQTYLATDLLHCAWRYISVRTPGCARNAALPADQFRDLGADVRGDTCIAAALRAWVSSRWFPGDLFDRSGIDEVIRRHHAGRGDVTQAVIMLATLATAFRLLLFERHAALPPEAELIA